MPKGVYKRTLPAWNKEKKLGVQSEEHKRKIGEAQKRFLVNGGKHSRGMLGKKHSKETKDKLRKNHKGGSIKGKKRKPLSIEHKRKISESNKGEKSYRWEGGITPLVLQIRHCFKYRQWRSDVFTRDNFTCQMCFKRGVKLNADHFPKGFSEIFHEYKIKTFKEAIDCEELWNINNGRILCIDCHRKTKNYGGVKKLEGLE